MAKRKITKEVLDSAKDRLKAMGIYVEICEIGVSMGKTRPSETSNFASNRVDVHMNAIVAINAVGEGSSDQIDTIIETMVADVGEQLLRIEASMK